MRVVDLPHPADDPAALPLLHGDVADGGGGRGPVPAVLAGADQATRWAGWGGPGSGSILAVPENRSAGPAAEGGVPIGLISMVTFAAGSASTVM